MKVKVHHHLKWFHINHTLCYFQSSTKSKFLTWYVLHLTFYVYTLPVSLYLKYWPQCLLHVCYVHVCSTLNNVISEIKYSLKYIISFHDFHVYILNLGVSICLMGKNISIFWKYTKEAYTQWRYQSCKDFIFCIHV